MAPPSLRGANQSPRRALMTRQCRRLKHLRVSSSSNTRIPLPVTLTPWHLTAPARMQNTHMVRRTQLRKSKTTGDGAYGSLVVFACLRIFDVYCKLFVSVHMYTTGPRSQTLKRVHMSWTFQIESPQSGIQKIITLDHDHNRAHVVHFRRRDMLQN